jgi:predicted DNA-binding transcriptional regulator AlpA
MPEAQSVHTGEFLGVEELSALLGQSPSAIYAARHRGQRPAALGIRVGRRIVWRRTDVDRWFSDTVEAQLGELAAR